MSDEIRIEGLQEVLKELEKIQDAETYKAGIKKACMLVERSAKQKAPKGDGELRRSIKNRVEDIEGNITGIVYTPLEYAPYVEYGTGIFAEEKGRQDVPWKYQDDKGNWHITSGMHPSPYLRPALYENIENIKTVIKKGDNNNA